ncbi:pyridoxamine 5'-phosphate oxidase family protein [Halobellus limi]|uniref:Pyridoxamine 5'-phosphate oxidase family protein n=1 Tax=Halobellus limi TaxID=699433 RepID=A0A1H5W3B1_9EURY|nr:pyridoxamine 5'-phosphate oxidase [Halobellus limi]QCC46558.1 pyridoxamine 5'-phosphate oxidase family protein [Halobellus limi]SEF93287.1 hypothetical protein SAMN04488133_1140 [Halobellus limi]
MHVTGPWSAEEAGAFLDATRVPVRLGCHTPSDHLWMLSLWFEWVEGDEANAGAAPTDAGTASAEVERGTSASDAATPELRCATGADAAVVEYLRNDPEVAFEVSTNEPPYKGVRGRGTASIEPDTDKRLLRSLFERYLGGTDNDLGDFLLDPDREEVRIRIRPERLHSWDFTERMADVSAVDADE